MVKENGRTARPRTSAEMEIDGELYFITTPEKIKDLAEGKEIRLVWPGKGELNMRIEAGAADRIIERSLFFNSDEVGVCIDNSIHEDGHAADPIYLTDYISIKFKESEKNDIAFNVTPTQAKVLASILTRYVQACEAVRSLQDQEPIRA
jgi:hypothetical protein